MPYISQAACDLGTCPAPSFPVTSLECLCTTATGGINELYFAPCTETMSEANVTDLAWWQAMVDAGTLGRSGLGVGSIGKKSTKTDRVSSCRAEQITMVTWALKYTIKCFDKTSARTTSKKITELLTNFSKYVLIARMCDGADTVLPVGVFTMSDLDWTVPEISEDNQSVSFELSWKELALPETVDVAGLSGVVPKLS